jgi:hypothetical protein
MITKILVSAAIALGSCIGGAALASADANPVGTDPFGALTCSCRETASPGSQALTAEMERGIWAGVTASPSKPNLS